MPCNRMSQTAAGTPPVVTDMGCGPGCDKVYKRVPKPGAGGGFKYDPVTPTCRDVTEAWYEGGQEFLGKTYCVCTIECPEDCTAKPDYDQGSGKLKRMKCTGDCCQDYFEKQDDTAPLKLRCKLVKDNGDKRLKCVCIIWTGQIADDEEKAKDEEKIKKDMEQKIKDLQKEVDDLKKGK